MRRLKPVSTLSAAALSCLLFAGSYSHGAQIRTDDGSSAASSSEMPVKATTGMKCRTARHNARRSHCVRILSNLPALKSSSVLVIDENTSSVLISKQPDVSTPIASITKLMTALVVLDANQPMDELVRISSQDREIGKGAYSRLPFGTSLSRGDLMHLALMSSENRAARTLGSHYPGGLHACIEAMNAKARALGMTRTHFADTTGLSSQNTASPGDLAKLVIAASQNPSIREYSTDKSYSVKAGKRRLEFRNTDNLVANSGWNIIVQKTGYTVEAGRCLVMKAVIEGRSIVIVLLDSFGKYTRVADAQRVRTWIQARADERIEHASMR